MAPHFAVSCLAPLVTETPLSTHPGTSVTTVGGLRERTNQDVVIDFQDKVSPDVFKGARAPAV